jgi:HAD superfamily hydrolase (TIGR01450 family)
MTPEIRRRLQNVRGFVFDVDGTLALGDRTLNGYQALPGAREMLQWLAARDIPFLTFTNGSTKTPQQMSQALAKAGFEIEPERALTPVSVAVEVFRRKQYRRILALGMEGVWRPLVDAGFDVIVSPERADDIDAVLLGWHPDLALADLEAASRAVWNGARPYAVSAAPYVASREGRTLGISGALAAALRSITGKRSTVVGKPSIEALRVASDRLGLQPSELAIVGDDPALENAMAHKGWALSIAVHTGLYGADDFDRLPHHLRPHLSLPGIDQLLSLVSRFQEHANPRHRINYPGDTT